MISKIESNKKRVLSNRKLIIFQEWNEKTQECFLRTKELLKSTIIATYYNPTMRACVFPDASDEHWGLQRHRPLTMMSGSFKGS